MFCPRQHRWLLTISALSVMLGVLMAPFQLARPAAAEMLVTTDYLVSHTSSEPFYAQYKLDPQVVLHVREVVLAGRERTIPNDGKVLLMLHGGTIPGYIAFDLDYAQCSMMRYLAHAGWDVFTLDYEGYGLSTRPLIMDVPAAFPAGKAPIHTEVVLSNITRVVDFISNLRGSKQVYVLGYSVFPDGPLYTIRHPEKVAKLVLLSPVYKHLGIAEPSRAQADTLETRDKVRYTRPTMEWLSQFGVPGAFEALRAAVLASDPSPFKVLPNCFSDS